MSRIAFDLDETLGVPIIDDGTTMTGWQVRPGCLDLLERLSASHTLCLWSASSRRYVDRVLGWDLGRWFGETYSWDEMPHRWKDVRRIRADFLIDDSPHHMMEAAREHGLLLARAYILVPAYGSPEDEADPLGWVRQVEARLAEGDVR